MISAVADLHQVHPQTLRLYERLGLLKPNEELTRERYASCVEKTAGELRANGFFSDKTAAWYAEQARTTALGPITSRR